MIKKLLKFLISLVLVVVLVAVGCGIYVIVSLKDPTDNTLKSVRDNNYPLQYLVNREMDESTKEIDTTNQMNFSLDEENLNEFLYAFVSKLEIPEVTIRGAYGSYLDNGGINIEVPLEVKGIQSVLYAGLKIENNNGTFVFTLLDAKVGKFNATSFVIKKFVLSNISSKELTSNLYSKNVYGDVSVEDLSVTFTEENLIKTFKELLKDDENVDMYAMLIDFLLKHENILSFELGKNKKIGFNFNLNDIQYDEARDDVIRHPLDLQTSKERTLAYENMNYTNISALYQYYVAGYDSLTDKDKETIDGLGLSKAEKGVKSQKEVNMLEILDLQAPKSPLEWSEVILNKGLSVDVTEKDFANIFCTMGFIGKSFAFGIDSSSLMNLTFESLSLDIKDDYFFINLIVNLSGKRFIVKAKCTAEESSTGTIDAVLQEISLGSITLDQEYIPVLLKYLDNSLKDEAWFEADPDNSIIHIKLQDLIFSSSKFDKLKELPNTSKMTFEDSSDGNGKLKLTYSLL